MISFQECSTGQLVYSLFSRPFSGNKVDDDEEGRID